MATTVEIKGNKMVITLDLTAPTASSTGKTLSVASTHGAMPSETKVDGKPVIVNVNAYIKA